MPIYCYEPDSGVPTCPHCENGFEELQFLSAPALKACPKCGTPVHRVFAPVQVGHSVSCLDDRAKAAGFSKLKRLGKGEYEKVY